MQHKTLITILILILIAIAGWLFFSRSKTDRTVNSNQPVVQEPVTQNPQTPPSNQQPSPATKDDLIVVTSPLPGATISSPLTITGRARGNWFFEATFPVTLVNWDGLIIAEGYAEAQGEWMTTEYVPFTAKLNFTADTRVSNRGWLILKKSNASGEPRFDNALEIPIYFK